MAHVEMTNTLLMNASRRSFTKKGSQLMWPRGILPRISKNPSGSVYLPEDSMPSQAMNKCHGLEGGCMNMVMGEFVFQVLYHRPRRD